ncbi:MAG: hypothetical protein ACTSPG_10080 [Candidatus Hodarchaeales archaeon]
MKRALSSFVIIKNNFDEGKDYIGAFVPLVLLLLENKKYQKVNIETICQDFQNEYGIQIPRHPMITIVNRLKPKYVTLIAGEYRINQEEVGKTTKRISYTEEITKYKWLLNHFISFCEGFTSEITLTIEKADQLFTNFFKEHDLDIIFAASGEKTISLLPNDTGKEESRERYLVNRYVNILMNQGGEHAKYLIDCAIGHNYASTILYREFANIRGKGFAEKYYLDSNLLFDLAGINGEFRKKSIVDFLSLLVSKKSKLFVFRHNYEEFLQIIESCLDWIDRKFYDPGKASRSLQYFKDVGCTSIEIKAFITQIPHVLDTNKIKIVDTPDPNIDKYYQISEETLKNTILDAYSSSGRAFNEEERRDTLQRDIVSISSIYKLRRGRVPTNLNDVTHVFVSCNSGLAYASTKFEKIVLKRGFFTVPTVLTDTFVGTMIWASKPADIVADFSRSKLIAYTNAVIQPSPVLIKTFTQQVQEAEKSSTNPISEDSALILLESGLSRYMLSDITLGDPNRVTDKTPYEVLEELKKTLSAEEHAKAEKAIQVATNEREDKERVERDLFNQQNSVKNWINRTANTVKWIIVILFSLVSFVSLGFAIFGNQVSLIVKVIEYVIGSLGLLTGFSVWKFGKKVEDKVKTILANHLLQLSNDDNA